ncbi:hypothetical protein [Sinorhizobium psoraleae]|uniref:Uncharacterized protein n=1 Tax=Sinorhizobium psoraleae TaxID=520838 RepID=A0ABT4KM57_9HYPH|nr:hypothetical protein [Sinorhizobium psoraleae]MCZ4093049.1 hypothetical protein [Sinorhizobium psoraleae]
MTTPPAQVAQAQGINPAIIEALTNPQATPQTQRIAAILLEQEQARQNALQEMRLKRGGSRHQLGLQKSQLEVEKPAQPSPDTCRQVGAREVRL